MSVGGLDNLFMVTAPAPDPGFQPLFRTKHHTWFNQVAHIARGHPSPEHVPVLLRCVIKDLLVIPNVGVVVEGVFFERSRRKKKVMSIAAVYASNVFWNDQCIVSDDEGAQDAQKLPGHPGTLPDIKLVKASVAPVVPATCQASLVHAFGEVTLLRKLLN